MAESLTGTSTVRFFDKRGLPPCDIAIFVKERPAEPYRQAVEHGSHIVYVPVDYYRAKAQLDADAPFLASCSALLVHSRRLGPVLAEHNSAIRYVDHPNLHGLVEKAPYRPAGFLLWVGDFLNLPYLLRWCELTGRSRDLRILTNARRTSLRGAAMTMSLARRLGVELDVRRGRINGIPMAEWDPGTQRALMRSAKAALDVKGGTEDFAQHTKPPTKAQQFIVSGIPFAASAEASAVEELLEDGFEIADVDDPERWFSREYWNATREYSVRLEERIRPAAVAASYRRCVDNLAGRPPAAGPRAVRPRPPGPPFVDGGSVRAYLGAGRALRAAGASWKDTAPSVVQKARAAYRDSAPGFVKCTLRDRRAARPPVTVSVLVDLTPEPGADPVGALPNGFPDTWEIVASRSLRISDWARARFKSIVRWPARGALRDRTFASALASGRYLAFVPRLDADQLAWIAEATAALERRPDLALIRRDEAEDGRLDPAATLVVRRDVWVSLQGYARGPSMGSPRCGDLDLLQRVRQLGFRDDPAPGEQIERTETRRRRPRAQGGIVVLTAITNGYDRLLPLEQRRVLPARRAPQLRDRRGRDAPLGAELRHGRDQSSAGRFRLRAGRHDPRAAVAIPGHVGLLRQRGDDPDVPPGLVRRLPEPILPRGARSDGRSAHRDRGDHRAQPRSSRPGRKGRDVGGRPEDRDPGLLLHLGARGDRERPLRALRSGGTKGVREASALLFTAYTGFNVVTNMAGSVRNPRRTVPLAIIGSILISAAIYIGVVLTILASGVEEFGAAGVGEAAEALMGNWGGYLIAFAACISTLSGANANLLGASEVMIRLVGQGDAPPVLARPTRDGLPFVSVIFIGVLTLVLVVVANVNHIVTYANVSALLAMIIVNVAAFRLARRKWPGDGLKLPGGVLIPTIAILACLAQFRSLAWPPALIGLGLVAGGLLIYHSRHRQELGENAASQAREAVDELDTPLMRAARSAATDSRRRSVRRGRPQSPRTTQRSGGPMCPRLPPARLVG